MRIDAGYILGHLSEFVLFLYFTTSGFESRKKWLKDSAAVLIGYSILFLIGLFGYAPISTIAFVVINILLFILVYRKDVKSAIFYSLIFCMLSNIGECLIAFFIGVDFSVIPIKVMPHQSLAITLGGKLFYLMGIVVLKHFSRKNSKNSLVLTTIPLITIICLFMMMKIEMNFFLFYVMCAALAIINVVALAANEIINEKNEKLELLQKEHERNKNVLIEYKILLDKYNNTRIMQHDFNKQLKVLKELIDTDIGQAKNHVNRLEKSYRELRYTQYTDNKILNILLEQKIRECHEHNVEIHIHSTSPALDFLSEIDTVAIFANLLDNAIEASEESTEKVVFVDLYTVNSVYSVIKVENSADVEPIVLDGMLQTKKLKYDFHGMGIKSINSSLKNYGSRLVWEYDRENKFFRAIVMLHVKK